MQTKFVTIPLTKSTKRDKMNIIDFDKLTMEFLPSHKTDFCEGFEMDFIIF